MSTIPQQFYFPLLTPNSTFGNNTHTFCYDVFKITGKLGVIPLVVSCVMTCIFLLVFCWSFISLIRISCSEKFPFKPTRVMFSVGIMIYALGRTAFYSLGIAAKGYAEHDKVNSEMNVQRLNTIANLIYQVASCFFYTAFCILTMYWSQNLLLAYGMTPKTILKSLRRSQILIYSSTAILSSIQIFVSVGLIIVICVVSVNVRHQFVPIVISCDLGYQSLLIVMLIIFFWSWHRYVHSKLDTHFLVVNLSNFDEMKKTRNATILISLIITLKLVWNVFSVVMNLFRHGLCMDDRYLLIAIVDIICDCLPLLLVGLFFGPKTNFNSSAFSPEQYQKVKWRNSAQFYVETDSNIAFLRSIEDDGASIIVQGTQRGIVHNGDNKVNYGTYYEDQSSE